MAIKDYRNLFWKKPENSRGAVPCLPKPALTAHYLIHSRQYFEQGYVFKFEGQSLSPNINKHTAQQPLPSSAVHSGLFEAPTNEELGSFPAFFPGLPLQQPGCC